MSSYNPLMSNCNHFVNYYVYIHTIHTMSIDMVIENSELMLLDEVVATSSTVTVAARAGGFLLLQCLD